MARHILTVSLLFHLGQAAPCVWGELVLWEKFVLWQWRHAISCLVLLAATGTALTVEAGWLVSPCWNWHSADSGGGLARVSTLQPAQRWQRRQSETELSAGILIKKKMSDYFSQHTSLLERSWKNKIERSGKVDIDSLFCGGRRSIQRYILTWWWLFPCLRGFFENIWTYIPRLRCFFFFFLVEINSHTLCPLFMPGSVHSGSGSWDDCGGMFLDKLRVSSFPCRFPQYFGTAA